MPDGFEFDSIDSFSVARKIKNKPSPQLQEWLTGNEYLFSPSELILNDLSDTAETNPSVKDVEGSLFGEFSVETLFKLKNAIDMDNDGFNSSQPLSNLQKWIRGRIVYNCANAVDQNERRLFYFHCFNRKGFDHFKFSMLENYSGGIDSYLGQDFFLSAVWSQSRLNKDYVTNCLARRDIIYLMVTSLRYTTEVDQECPSNCKTVPFRNVICCLGFVCAPEGSGCGGFVPLFGVRENGTFISNHIEQTGVEFGFLLFSVAQKMIEILVKSNVICVQPKLDFTFRFLKRELMFLETKPSRLIPWFSSFKKPNLNIMISTCDIKRIVTVCSEFYRLSSSTKVMDLYANAYKLFSSKHRYLDYTELLMNFYTSLITWTIVVKKCQHGLYRQRKKC